MPLNDLDIEINYRRNDPRMGQYNYALLQAWRANMDLSPIHSVIRLMMYLSKYISKGEKQSSHFYSLYEECSNESLSVALRKMV